MAPRKPTWKAPFDERGVLMHYAHPGRYGEHPVKGAPGVTRTWDTASSWREPEPIVMTLTVEGTTRGRSAAYFEWRDESGHRWPMFITDVLEVLQKADVRQGVVAGTWVPVKRGQNFGLRYLAGNASAPAS